MRNYRPIGSFIRTFEAGYYVSTLRFKLIGKNAMNNSAVEVLHTFPACGFLFAGCMQRVIGVATPVFWLEYPDRIIILM